MSANAEFKALSGLDRASQMAWMNSLRPIVTTIELLFHDGDTDHPLVIALASLSPIRQKGVGPRPGYRRPQPNAILHRYPYDRAIVRTINELGGLFEYVAAATGDTVHFTRLGNVDVTFLDRYDEVLGSTVTHEGLILTPVDASTTRT